MLSFLSGLVLGILNLLNSLLPDSPLKDLETVPEAIHTGVGWLNWFLPVTSCAAFLTAVLGVLVVYVGVRFIMSKALTVSKGLV